MAERRSATQITQPDPPNRQVVEGRSFPHNEPVAARKDTILLILHFEVPPRLCPLLDRQRLLVKDGEGKSYQYGGWRVDDAQYTLCRVPPPAASVEIGPWENDLWDPMAIRPRFGSLDLVYPVNPKAGKLVFTDGIVEIELDPLVKP